MEEKKEVVQYGVGKNWDGCEACECVCCTGGGGGGWGIVGCGGGGEVIGCIPWSQGCQGIQGEEGLQLGV